MRMWDAASRRLGRVSVVAGAVTTTGMFDRQSELILDDQVIMVENALKRAHLSYQTKISRTKKHGRQFIVILMEPADGA